MLLLSIACALGWSLAALFAWKFYRYAKPFQEATARLEATNKRAIDAIARLDSIATVKRQVNEAMARHSEAIKRMGGS